MARRRRRIPKRNNAVVGIEELLEQLDGLTTDNLWGPVGDAALNAVHNVETRAKQLAADHVVTGRFRDGIQSHLFKRRDGKGITGFVQWYHGGIQPYNEGVLIEFGTRKTKPLKIFTRAWAETKKQVLSGFQEDLKQAIDEAIK